VGRRAVTLHASAQRREPTEHGVERIRRTHPRDYQVLGARTSERRELVGDPARRATREPHGQEAATEPFGLLLERRLEARPLPGVEALLGDGAERRRTEAADGDEPARGARRRLDGVDRALADDQRRDLAFGDGLARLHGLPGEKGEDRYPLERVRIPQRTPTDLEEPAARRGERPLPAAVAFHLDAIADDRRREPSPGVLLVEVAGLHREDVNLVPGRREQRRGGLRREARTLLDGDLARRVAYVVAQHAVDEALERRRLPSLRDRLHRSGGRTAGAIGGWPETRCDPAAFRMSPFIPPGAARPARSVGGLRRGATRLRSACRLSFHRGAWGRDGPWVACRRSAGLRRERLAAAATARGLDLGHDREGDLGRRARAEVEADRDADALELGVA